MKHIINIDTWERKDNYNFFRGFANSWIAITSEADCTEASKNCVTGGTRTGKWSITIRWM